MNLTETVYRSLKDYVLSAEVKPGSKLKISELATLVDASPSVVREALSRLTSEGLVVSEPQKGFRAAPLDPNEVKYLLEARVKIECICLADAIHWGDLAWEGRVVATLHTLSKTPEERGRRGADVSSEWLEAHANFHLALVSAARNPWLLRVRDNLYLHSERFRALALRYPTTDRDIRAEHEQIAQAAIGRNEDLACHLMAEHLARTVEDLSWSAVQPAVEAAI